MVYETKDRHDVKNKKRKFSNMDLVFFNLVGWDFGYCGHYWPIVPVPDDR
jgi:hypothetical protein